MSEHLIAITPSNLSGAEVASLRSDLYFFLSRVLLYPKEELGDAWQRAVAASSILMLEGGRVFQSLKPPALEGLQREFVATFTHTNPSTYPVYEVEYGSSQPFRDSRHLSRLAGFYRAFGLEPAQGERLDHIGVELEFMYFLAYKEAYAGRYLGAEKEEVCRYAQKRFLEEHLGRWTPLFFRRLKDEGQGYYSRIASATLAFLAWEHQHLGAQPNVVGEEYLLSSEGECPAWGCADENPL